MSSPNEKYTDSRLYQSYMLRLWRDHPEGEWRVSLENIFTGERKLFADLIDLFTYICARSGQSALPRESFQRSLAARKEDSK